jgi:hypothetical protein
MQLWLWQSFNRHQELGFLRSTRRCSERNQLILISSWYVMIQTYSSGLLSSRCVFGDIETTQWKNILNYCLRTLVLMLSGTLGDSLWRWCLPACLCYPRAIPSATSSSSVLDKNFPSKCSLQGHFSYWQKKTLSCEVFPIPKLLCAVLILWSVKYCLYANGGHFNNIFLGFFCW